MTYLKQKLSESTGRGYKINLLFLAICGLGLYVYFGQRADLPQGSESSLDGQVIIITKLKFDTWAPPTGKETLSAGKFAVFEPNIIKLSEGVEVIDHTASRGFDQLNAETAIAQFQASNAVQVLNGAQILEAFFPGPVTIKKDGASLVSSDVKADYRTNLLSSSNRTEAKKNKDNLISENGFKMNLSSGDFEFMGPMNGQVEKLP